MSEQIAVLCVEDADTESQTAAVLDEEDGVTAAAVTGITAVLDRLVSGRFDAVVSGYGLSEQDGVELVERIRDGYPALPIVLFPRDGDEAATSEALSAGASEYVQNDGTEAGYQELVERLRPLVRADDERHGIGEESARQRLIEVTSDVNLDHDEKIQRLLKLGCDAFDLENGHLVRIDTGRHLHEVISVYGSEVVRADVSDLLETYCRKTIESGDVHAVHDARDAGWEGDPAFEKYGIECYLGGTISFDDELYGTLCFVDERPRERPFSAADRQLFDLIRRWCSQLLAWQREQQQAQTVFNYTQDGIFVIEVAEEKFQIERVNDAYERLTGFDREAITGKTPTELLGEREGERVRARYQACVEERAPVSYEETLTIDGETRHWQTKLAPVVEKGHVVRLVGATRDVTEQKRQAAELREERAFIEQSLNALDDVFYVFDSSNEIHRWNDALERVTGYTEEELEGMQPTEFFPEEHRQRVAEAVGEMFETGRARAQADYLTKDGTRIPYEFTGVRLTAPDTDETVGFVGIGRDITDQLTYERELERQNEQLEQFASVVSHDLRNPLDVAISHTELARDECDTEHLSKVQGALDRITTLINDVLALARQGERVSERERIDLETLMSACWRTVDTSDATLVLETSQTFDADRSRLKQVLENLVRNAIEHGGDDVTITVGDLEDGFYVEDDGPGIDPDERENVFEGGYSLAEGGSGLGLAIVEQIATAHGWEISLAAAESGGARFGITGIGP